MGHLQFLVAVSGICGGTRVRGGESFPLPVQTLTGHRTRSAMEAMLSMSGSRCVGRLALQTDTLMQRSGVTVQC